VLLKANAYGHGLEEIAKLAKICGVKKFFVFNMEEALQFRMLGHMENIVVMGYVHPGNFKNLLEYDIQIALSSLDSVKSLVSYCKNVEKQPKVHLKFDTGFNRQGVKENDYAELGELLKNNRCLRVEGIMTHFSVADEPSEKLFTEEQIFRFNKCVEFMSGINITYKYQHLSNTAATMLYPDSNVDVARIGLGQFGLWPSESVKNILNQHNSDNVKKIELFPVLTWKTMLIQIKRLARGESVGYGRTFKAENDMIIGVLPVGYADGLDRGLSNEGNVIVAGKRAPIIGRISMNLTTIDLSNIQNVNVGDEVVLIGRQGSEEISADELAGKLNTINYEVVTRINRATHRSIV